MGGLGQERRDLPCSIPARASVQVQPGVDSNSAATQRDRLTPVQPIERTDPDPSWRGTGLTRGLRLGRAQTQTSLTRLRNSSAVSHSITASAMAAMDSGSEC